MTEVPLKLELNADELNLILESLGNLPFVRVFNLIGKIQSQASAQMIPVAQAAPLAADQDHE